MAIALEFIDFIIPIQKIREKYPGGWERFVQQYKTNIGRTNWYDDHLYRMGAMNGDDIQSMAGYLESVGFEISRQTPDGKTEWIDACVYSMLSSKPFCSWLSTDIDSNGRKVAYVTGTEMGATIGRKDFESIVNQDKNPK